MERGGEREKEGRDERKKRGRKELFMDYIMHLSDYLGVFHTSLIAFSQQP